MIEVPWRDIAPETLDSLIGEFVTRDGTDYGEQEVPLARKIAQVRHLLQRGDVLVVFVELDESVNIVTRDAWRAVQDPAG